MPLVVYEERATSVEGRSGDGLLLIAPDDLPAATGWELKPEGVCRGEICVPLAPADEHDLVRDGRFDLVAFGRRLGQAIVHDAEADAWGFGYVPTADACAGRDVTVPDLTLPDLDGTPWSLAGFRGSKVLLLAWASW